MLKISKRYLKWFLNNHQFTKKFWLTSALVQARAGKNLRNTGLNLTSKFGIFWGFVLKKPQILDPKKPQTSKPQPQKYWPHPHLKVWGILRFFHDRPQSFYSSLNLEKTSVYFCEVFRGSSKYLNFRWVFLSPISRPCQILVVYFGQKPEVQNSTQGRWKCVCSCTPSFLATSLGNDCFGHVMS